MNSKSLGLNAKLCVKKSLLTPSILEISEAIEVANDIFDWHNFLVCLVLVAMMIINLNYLAVNVKNNEIAWYALFLHDCYEKLLPESEIERKSLICFHYVWLTEWMRSISTTI